MTWIPGEQRFTVFVGSGGVGKTTLAAAAAVREARAGRRTLVMTFDPSLRLKDALGVGDARDSVVPVALGEGAPLDASLLDARRTFDRLVQRYAPDEAAKQRILTNRFYSHLAGHLGGILEYMAVERLYEVAREGIYERIILDTPPTRQALDFLEAPDRIVAFLDSGALGIALKPWFDDDGRLRATSRVPLVGHRIEAFLDRIVGLDLLRDMGEFFQAFGPLFDGFRQRALRVQELLRSPETGFVLVGGPGEERIADTMFFARRLEEAGHHLRWVVVNRIHPRTPVPPDPPPAGPAGDALRLLHWLGERDAHGLAALRDLLPSDRLVGLPLLPDEPTSIPGLSALADLLDRVASGAPPGAGRTLPG